jgi:hypothetical protein
MAKETVRYPDALVSEVEAVVAASEAFESKSEFYRFASDFLLSVLDPTHEPSVLGYGDIVAELESTTDGRLVPRDDGGETAAGPFLDAYIQVRRHLLYDDVEAARTVVGERYDATDREALLLDEVIGRERHVRGPAGDPIHSRDPTAATGSVDGRTGDGTGNLAESRNDPVDGSTAEDGSTTERDREPTDRPAEALRETDGGLDASDESDGS